MRVYFAAPFFCEAEQGFNEDFVRLIECAGHSVFYPYRDGPRYGALARNMGAEAAADQVFARDILELNGCDALVAVLDGRVTDEGVCWELGYAFAKGKLIVGYCSDMRRFRPEGHNPMIAASLVGAIEDSPHLVIRRLG